MNKLSSILNKFNNYPLGIKRWLNTFFIGRTVKMVGASGIKFENLEPQKVVVSLQNKTKVQNHIGQIHAAATTLLAETATGIVVGLSLPDDKIPLIKNFNVKFIKRSQGAQFATATLNQDQINKIKTDEKGDLMVPVKVVDQTGQEVVIAEMNWAWIPKKIK